MQVLNRDPLVNLPQACTGDNGTYSGWAYYVHHTGTTVAGVEIFIDEQRYGWNGLDALDRANDAVNAVGEPLNRVGALVIARHCQNEHLDEGARLELGETYVVADNADARPLGSVRVNFDYQTATTFEPGAEPDEAQPLFLPFHRGMAFPDTVAPVSYGARRFLVGISSGALLIRRGMLARD